MALKATILKATLNIADMDRHYYGDHQMTLAQHPSETDERLMIRLLAFVHNAHEDLTFTKGLSTDDEPELWRKSLTDDIEQWIELGLPDEDRIRKACNRADEVILYTYGGRAVPVWWEKIRDKVTRFHNLKIFDLPQESVDELTKMADRGMNLQCSIQDGDISIGNEDSLVNITPQALYPA